MRKTTLADLAADLGLEIGDELVCRSHDTKHKRTRRGDLMTKDRYLLVAGDRWFVLERMTFAAEGEMP